MVRDLVEHDYEVINVDVVPTSPAVAPFLRADLTDYGEAVEALRGADAVVHLAAIPAPRIRTVERTFEINILSTYNVFSAAGQLGLNVSCGPRARRCSASRSGTAMPATCSIRRRFRAITRSRTTCRSTRSIRSARIRATRCPRSPGRRWPASSPGGPASRSSACASPRSASRPSTRRFPTPGPTRIAASGTSGGYVDARDVGQACRLALSADVSGAEVFIIAAGDTAMDRPNSELMTECFPSVPLRPGTGDFETLLSIDKARRVLGYDPGYSWRDEVGVPVGAGSSRAKES